MEESKVKELAKFFFTDIIDSLDTATREDKFFIMNQIKQAGLGYNLLKEIMIDYKSKSTIEKANLSPILYAYKDSLVRPGIFYFHPRLQVSSKPPKIVQLDDGEFVESYEEPFFLRNTRVFTLEHLAQYFHSQMHTKTITKARDDQSLRYLLKACDDNLDLAMYTIDIGTAITLDRGDKPLVTAIYASDYIHEARWTLEQRISYSITEGLDHEIL